MKPSEPLSFKDIVSNKKSAVKAPAYVWQDLALKIERELHIPAFKRSAVFKVCKDYPRSVIERCLADTKELCVSGDQWKYFFKVVATSGQAYTAATGDRRQIADHTAKP